MNKSQLIDAIADQVGGKGVAAKAVEAVLEQIQRRVSAGEKVVITGFGVFERQQRAARTARNPATGAAVKVKKSTVPKFRPGTEFKAYVGGAKKFAKASPATAKAAARGTGTVTARAGKVTGRATSAIKAAPTKSTRAATTQSTKAKPAKSTKPAPAPASMAPAKTATRARVQAAVKAPARARAAAKAPAKRVPSTTATDRKAPAKRGTR